MPRPPFEERNPSGVAVGAAELSTWDLIQGELRRLWAPRYRLWAVVTFVLVFLVQVAISTALFRSPWVQRPEEAGWFHLLISVTGVQALFTPIVGMFQKSDVPSLPLLTLIQVVLFLANTAWVFLAPAFAARSVAPDWESGRLHEQRSEGLSPREILLSRGAAAMLPLLGVLAVAVMLVFGILAGVLLTGREHLLGVMPEPPPGFPRSTFGDPVLRDALQVGTVALGWIATAMLLCAVGAVCRTTRAALIWCYAVPFVFLPPIRFGIDRVMAQAPFVSAVAHTLLEPAAVMAVQLTVAALLYHRAVRSIQDPDDSGPWMRLRRPLMWDVPLTDRPADRD